MKLNEKRKCRIFCTKRLIPGPKYKPKSHSSPNLIGYHLFTFPFPISAILFLSSSHTHSPTQLSIHHVLSLSLSLCANGRRRSTPTSQPIQGKVLNLLFFLVLFITSDHFMRFVLAFLVFALFYSQKILKTLIKNWFGLNARIFLLFIVMLWFQLVL